MLLTDKQKAEIEKMLSDAIESYPVPGEHYAYVSTLLAHVQADFSQALDYWGYHLSGDPEEYGEPPAAR